MSYSKVNLFGLGAGGRPIGMNPAWGAIAATALGTTTTIAVEELSDMDEYAEAIGFGAAAVASAGMIAFPKTRHAGWTGLAVALLNHGPRQLQRLFSAKAKAVKAVEQAAAATAEAASQAVNGVRINTIPSLGNIRANTIPSLGNIRMNSVPTVAGLGQPRMLSAAGAQALLAAAKSGYRSSLISGRR